MSVNNQKKPAYLIGMYAIITLMLVILLIPFLSLVSTSFKPFEETIVSASLLPKEFTWGNYKEILLKQNYFSGLFYSVFIALVTTLGTLFSASFVAYAFVRFNIKCKEAVFSLLMMSSMIPGQVLQISLYSTFVNIGWMDTLLPLTIPPFLGGGFMNMFLIRQFFRGLPKSLFEAAEIDGARELKIYATIVLPLSVPILMTVGLFTFVGAWNDFMGPLLYLGGKEELYPLALLMYNMNSRLKIGDTKQWNLISAGNVLMMLPTIVIYLSMQKYFRDGVAVSGMKE